MKVLVATNETQGHRDNDFAHTKEGELVYPGSRCSRGFTDDGCGCYRCLSGAETRKGTTTMKVVDLPMTRAQWVAAVAKSECDGGWGSIAELMPIARDKARVILDAIAAFPVGAVVEYRDDVLRVRSSAKN